MEHLLERFHVREQGLLDDLVDWVAATLDLLEDLLTPPGVPHLMLIGAYRDNEVTAAHPLKQKLEAIRRSEAIVWAEMGALEQELPGPCVVMAQGDRDKLAAVVLATVEGDKIKRLDLCGAPSPHSAIRSGIYPGRNDKEATSC